jgi:hypothetical protein
MNYGDLIKDAFWITLRNRYLWFFGFFAGGTSANFNFPSVPSGRFDDNDFERRASVPVVLAQAGQDAFGEVTLIVAIIALVVLIVLLFIILSLISQGALAESVAALDRGERRRFSSTWRAGVSNFWRVLAYFMLFILISLGFLLAIGVPLALLMAGVYFGTESSGALILTIVLAALVGFGLLIVVFVPLGIVAQFALREIVVRREGVVGSIGSGYRLFRSNLSRSLLIWLIQLAIWIGAGIVLLILLLLLGLILFLPTIFLAVAEYVTAALATGVVAGLILLPLLLVAVGALGTFNHSYWTLAYLRLTAPPQEPTPQLYGGA